MSDLCPATQARLAHEIRRANHCHGLTVRGGEEEPCGKPPVAILYDREFDDYWPACAWHANRYGPGVPLADLLAALTADTQTRQAAHSPEPGPSPTSTPPTGNEAVTPRLSSLGGHDWLAAFAALSANLASTGISARRLLRRKDDTR